MKENLPIVFDDYIISDRQKIYNNLTNPNHAWFYDASEIKLQQIANSYSNVWLKILILQINSNIAYL